MDKDFHDLLTRYVNGNCSLEEIALINRWYEEIEDKDLELGEIEKGLIKARMLRNVQSALQSQGKSPKRRFLVKSFIMKCAAAVLLVFISYVWILRQGNPSQEESSAPGEELSDLVTFENKADSARSYSLPDGSTVRLASFGKIHFSPDVFEIRREVYLTGGAFFDIARDTARPFYVYSGKIATQVLGTSFFVDAPVNAVKVEVKVITGRVSVFPITPNGSPGRDRPSTIKNSTANGVVLSPNQKVDYFIEGGHWVIGLVEEPLPVKSIDEDTFSFVFENAAIKDVLGDVAKRYGIEVLTENERIYNCTFTGDVSRMSLYDMLDVVSNSIGATYEVKGTQILVSGNGCY